jgi:Cys-tRNA(Pro)/Cys-tRNA(Cys) deacylase
MTIKNNVTRMLDAKSIKFSAFVLPAEKLGALEAAEFLGVDPSKMFKTLVAIRPQGGKAILAMVPGTEELDLKALAKAVGEKKIKLSTHKEAEQLTRLQTGGISPLALLNRGFQIVIDLSANEHEDIIISGGQRGLNVQLAPDDLIKITQAKVAKISKSSD